MKTRINKPIDASQQKVKRNGASLAPPSIQRKENKTGMPDQLKSGIENLSGINMSDVKVHYNSSQPAQLNAHAYAQGNQIHIAPGQQKHLPHEAWHVVQQKQGRVKPTMQMKGKVNINNDKGLENEADVMGKKAIQTKQKTNSHLQEKNPPGKTFQREENESLINPGTIRSAVDLAGGLAGLKSDPKKPKTKLEEHGKKVKIVGSAAKLAAKTVASGDAAERLKVGGTNFKVVGEDLSEAGKVFKDKDSTKAKKVAAGARAAASVAATASETVRSTLQAFGIADKVVPASVITLVSDSIKSFTFTHDLLEAGGKIYTSIKEGKSPQDSWNAGMGLLQKAGSASLAVLRTFSVWERLQGSAEGESYYLKLMPLGKTLLNLATTLSQVTGVYNDYKNYSTLMKMSNNNKGNDSLKMLAYGKWDQLVKNFVDTFVSIGETIYWAGKYFVAIKPVSAMVGATSKALKTASAMFSSYNVRQVARDYVPSLGGLGGYLVDKTKTSDKLAGHRQRIISFLQGKKSKGNKELMNALGIDPGKADDDEYMKKLVKTYI